MTSEGTMLLKRHEVAGLLDLDECIKVTENAFKWQSEGRELPPGILGMHAGSGGFHIKTGLVNIDKKYFVAKVNANFPGNMKSGLPTIQGLILIMDGENGRLLAVMDSIEITILRTGAATAVAAKHLSRFDSKVVTVCGCGNQGRVQLRSLLKVRPLQQAFVYDTDTHKAQVLVEEFSKLLSIQAVSQANLSSSFKKSDVCVTCTPSRQFFLRREDVAPGTFIAAVGADSEEKQEIDPRLFIQSKIVVDILDQSATIGDLHHALEQGIVTKGKVHAELGEIVTGKKQGRSNNEEVIIFDSTGMALQDAAAAIMAYTKAMSVRSGSLIPIN